LRESSLRYDVTVTLPGALGEEFVKTAGHYHTRSPAGPTYPEVYEVLNGRAAFVLQRVDDPEGSEPEVQEVWVAVCVPGEKIVNPPTAATPRSTSGRSPWRSLTWYRVVPRTTTALSGRPEEEPTT
jgi:glucose-6-phosphate isomerase, archaeal